MHWLPSTERLCHEREDGENIRNLEENSTFQQSTEQGIGTNKIRVDHFGVKQETRSPFVVEIYENARELSESSKVCTQMEIRPTCAKLATISCCTSISLLYSPYGQWPRTFPSHLASSAVPFKSLSCKATTDNSLRNELAHADGPDFSSFEVGISVIQAAIRDAYIWESEVRVFAHPSRTAFRADLAGKSITIKVAAVPVFSLVRMIIQKSG